MSQLPQRPWQATVHAQLTRAAGVDQVEEIDTDGEGQFTRRLRVVSGPGPGAIELLSSTDLRQLLDELRAEVKAPPAGVDVGGLEAFVDLLEDVLRVGPPSHRFDDARFGQVTKDETRGIIYGHVVLGVDVIGTLRDGNHELFFEQQLVTGPSGVYRPLSPADSASLARALTANPPADPLWEAIRQDAEAGAASVV
jgi:hypothetical protein